jgi:hypothetical protein
MRPIYMYSIESTKINAAITNNKQLILAIFVFRLYCSLKQRRRGVSVGGIHYSRTSAEEEPLTLGADHSKQREG